MLRKCQLRPAVSMLLECGTCGLEGHRLLTTNALEPNVAHGS